MAGVACFPAGSRRGLERARQRVRTAASVSLCVHRRSPGAGASLLQKGRHAPRTGPLLLELQGPLRLGVLAGLAWAWWAWALWDYSQTVIRMPQAPGWLSSSGFASAKPKMREMCPALLPLSKKDLG